MVLQRDSQVCFTIMQVFSFFKKTKQLASDANTLRVIWRGDHMSMDDTYWQDDKEYAGGKHRAFCTVTLKFANWMSF